MWCQSRTTWISDKYLSACFEELDINDFKNQECYVGVDLASTSDLCATVVMFIRDEEYYFFPIFYIPLETLNDRPDTHKYQNWHQRKLITITDGNTTNYDMITNDLIEVDNNHIIRQIAYDRYNAQKWALDCQNKGLPMREFSQSIGNFNSPTRHMEMIILSGKAHFHRNEILLHHFKNVMLKLDHNGNIKPTKSNGKAGGQARNKIDGVIAAIQALATGLYDNRTSGMIY